MIMHKTESEICANKQISKSMSRFALDLTFVYMNEGYWRFFIATLEGRCVRWISLKYTHTAKIERM